jgi:hypothetical protein
MNKPQDSVAIIGSKETRCWRNNRYSDNNLLILWSIFAKLLMHKKRSSIFNSLALFFTDLCISLCLIFISANDLINPHQQLN